MIYDHDVIFLFRYNSALMAHICVFVGAGFGHTEEIRCESHVIQH